MSKDCSQNKNQGITLNDTVIKGNHIIEGNANFEKFEERKKKASSLEEFRKCSASYLQGIICVWYRAISPCIPGRSPSMIEYSLS
jgi:hypothetical protein